MDSRNQATRFADSRGSLSLRPTLSQRGQAGGRQLRVKVANIGRGSLSGNLESPRQMNTEWPSHMVTIIERDWTLVNLRRLPAKLMSPKRVPDQYKFGRKPPSESKSRTTISQSCPRSLRENGPSLRSVFRNQGH
jgi:hypothetical protein